MSPNGGTHADKVLTGIVTGYVGGMTVVQVEPGTVIYADNGATLRVTDDEAVVNKWAKTIYVTPKVYERLKSQVQIKD